MFISQVLCWPSGRKWLCCVSQSCVGARHPNQQAAQQHHTALLWFGVPAQSNRTTRQMESIIKQLESIINKLSSQIHVSYSLSFSPRSSAHTPFYQLLTERLNIFLHQSNLWMTVLVACSCGLLSLLPIQYPSNDSNYAMQLTMVVFSLRIHLSFDKKLQGNFLSTLVKM